MLLGCDVKYRESLPADGFHLTLLNMMSPLDLRRQNVGTKLWKKFKAFDKN